MATARNKILLVEDNAELRAMMGLALESEGYEIVYAKNGREALERLKENPPPFLILLDLMMPVMNGQEFLEQFALDKRVSDIPVIICSAIENRPQLTAPFLKKPIDLEELTSAVQRYRLASSSP
jgi:CheY-like chemotaxis protein